MAYGEGQANTVAPPNSLVTDSGRVVERLQNIHERLVDLGNKLHGSSPRDASSIGGKIEPEPTLRRNIDKAGNWLADIEGELQRIDARV